MSDLKAERALFGKKTGTVGRRGRGEEQDINMNQTEWQTFSNELS